jgi:hypothetical protein
MFGKKDDKKGYKPWKNYGDKSHSGHPGHSPDNNDGHIEYSRENFPVEEESKSIGDQVTEILHNTNDGDDLSPSHLHLLQIAMNGGISEAGEVELQKVYKEVKDGNYEPDAFYGIKGMSQDHEGYILWHGKQIEHYSFDDPHEEKESAEILHANILDLEKQNKEITSGNILANYDHLYESHPELSRETFYVRGYDEQGEINRDTSGYVRANNKDKALEEFQRKNGEHHLVKVETYPEYNDRLEKARNR